MHQDSRCWKNRKFTSMCSSLHSVSEMKMEEILSVLTRDDCFKGSRWGSQVSFLLIVLVNRCHSFLDLG